MEEKFIYIMSCQRGQGLPEIHYICDYYDEAIKAYYTYHLKDNKDFLKSRDRNYWFMYLYQFPISKDFKTDGKSWSNIKLGKSCKYRIKFKYWGDLIDEFKMVNRNIKLNELID